MKGKQKNIENQTNNNPKVGSSHFSNKCKKKTDH